MLQQPTAHTALRRSPMEAVNPQLARGRRLTGARVLTPPVMPREMHEPLGGNDKAGGLRVHLKLISGVRDDLAYT